jgi:hypothetical protein
MARPKKIQPTTQAPANSKPLSPKELKSWLRGIQEFQPGDWTPTKDQWKLICERIYELNEAEVETQTTAATGSLQNPARNFQHEEYAQQHHVAGEPIPSYMRMPAETYDLDRVVVVPGGSGHSALAHGGHSALSPVPAAAGHGVPTEADGMLSVSKLDRVVEGAESSFR